MVDIVSKPGSEKSSSVNFRSSLTPPQFRFFELVDVVGSFFSASNDRGMKDPIDVVRSNPRPGPRGDDQYRERLANE